MTADDGWDWRFSALCGQIGGEPFFPGKGEKCGPAKKLCAQCPVREECLADALTRPSWDDQYGVRGGLSARQRDKLRKQAAA